MAVIAALVAWLTACTVALALGFRHTVAAAWREPVLRAPVLILESDDWGYGPVEQAQALRRIADVLAGFWDDASRHPVMTLGVILAGPDTAAIRSFGLKHYCRLTLTDQPLLTVREAMLDGAKRGVLALQLHGREHYWPDCLMRAAAERPQVRDWLIANGLPRTEELPSELQSRWMDASALPSQPLPRDRVRCEAACEVRAFAEAFGTTPDVAVPPTFAWTRDVEDAWVRAGVRTIVTPGRRSESRDATGRFVYEDRRIHNGDRGRGDCVFLVRDVYFEPVLGHDHRRAVGDVVAKTRLGRPALVEIHRMNFVPPGDAADKALDELGRLIEEVRKLLPDMRFMSTSELAGHYREQSDMLERRTAARLHFLFRRLAGVSKLRKLAWITGAIVPASIAYAITRPAAGRRR